MRAQTLLAVGFVDLSPFKIIMRVTATLPETKLRTLIRRTMQPEIGHSRITTGNAFAGCARWVGSDAYDVKFL
jgi:hypothetical protein